MIASLHTMGRLEHAYYAQTGPYQQGARLTSLELNDLGIPATMCLDTAVAALLAGEHGRRVHAFIAGADRCVRASGSIREPGRG
jgi:methylthioribose-1-phosphate isomerase